MHADTLQNKKIKWNQNSKSYGTIKNISKPYVRYFDFFETIYRCFGLFVWKHPKLNRLIRPQKQTSTVSPTTAMFYFYKFFWSVLRSKALETPQLGFRELNGRKSCWTCQTFSGTFSGILLNLTWTFSRTFSGTFSGTLLNLTWLCTKASRNLLWNPVEPDLALHQTLPEPSPERSPEPCWTWPGFATKPPRPSPEPSSEPSPDWLCTKASHTFSGTLLNLTWLWTKAFQTFCETSSGMFSGTLLYVTWLCTKASQTLSGTFGTQSKKWASPLILCVCLFSSERKSAWISTDITHALDSKWTALQGVTWQQNVHAMDPVKCSHPALV